MSAARDTRRDRAARVDLETAWGVEQGLLANAPWFAAYFATFAPSYSYNAHAYSARTYLQFRREDEDDEDDDRSIRRRYGVDLRRVLAAAIIAGATNEPESIDARTEIAAVHLAYHRNERVRFMNLDLDGRKPPVEVLRAIRREVGDDALLVTSGSGKADRYRVLLRLAKSKKVDDLQRLAKQWLAGVGLSLQDRDIEVFPSTNCGRLPFGLGGCKRFDLDLQSSAQEKPMTLWRAFENLKPIDLRALAQQYPTLPEQTTPQEIVSSKTTPQEIVSSKTTPRRYVAERRPPTPKHKRELWKHGVARVGERDAVLYQLAVDCRYRRLSQESAVERLTNWIEEGKIAESRVVRTDRGYRKQIADLPRLVHKVYATHAIPGRPEPVPLTSAEAERITEIATTAARANNMTEQAIRALLFGILPLFKAARLAGLTKVRIHKQEWEKAGGSRYSALRDACGCFAAVTTHRAAKSLEQRGLSPAKAQEHAYAKSWQTSFRFDV